MEQSYQQLPAEAGAVPAESDRQVTIIPPEDPDAVRERDGVEPDAFARRARASTVGRYTIESAERRY